MQAILKKFRSLLKAAGHHFIFMSYMLSLCTVQSPLTSSTSCLHCWSPLPVTWVMTLSPFTCAKSTQKFTTSPPAPPGLNPFSILSTHRSTAHPLKCSFFSSHTGVPTPQHTRYSALEWKSHHQDEGDEGVMGARVSVHHSPGSLAMYHTQDSYYRYLCSFSQSFPHVPWSWPWGTVTELFPALLPWVNEVWSGRALCPRDCSDGSHRLSSLLFVHLHLQQTWPNYLQ